MITASMLLEVISVILTRTAFPAVPCAPPQAKSFSDTAKEAALEAAHAAAAAEAGVKAAQAPMFSPGPVAAPPPDQSTAAAAMGSEVSAPAPLLGTSHISSNAPAMAAIPGATGPHSLYHAILRAHAPALHSDEQRLSEPMPMAARHQGLQDSRLQALPEPGMQGADAAHSTQTFGAISSHFALPREPSMQSRGASAPGPAGAATAVIGQPLVAALPVVMPSQREVRQLHGSTPPLTVPPIITSLAAGESQQYTSCVLECLSSIMDGMQGLARQRREQHARSTLKEVPSPCSASAQVASNRRMLEQEEAGEEGRQLPQGQEGDREASLESDTGSTGSSPLRHWGAAEVSTTQRSSLSPREPATAVPFPLIGSIRRMAESAGGVEGYPWALRGEGLAGAAAEKSRPKVKGEYRRSNSAHTTVSEAGWSSAEDDRRVSWDAPDAAASKEGGVPAEGLRLGAAASAAARIARLATHRETASLLPATQQGLMSAGNMHQQSASQSHARGSLIAPPHQPQPSAPHGPLRSTQLEASAPPNAASSRLPPPTLNSLADRYGVSSVCSAPDASARAALLAVHTAALCDMIERELLELVWPHLQHQVQGLSSRGSIQGVVWVRLPCAALMPSRQI